MANLLMQINARATVSRQSLGEGGVDVVQTLRVFRLE